MTYFVIWHTVSAGQRRDHCRMFVRFGNAKRFAQSVWDGNREKGYKPNPDARLVGVEQDSFVDLSW